MDAERWLGSITLYEAAQIWAQFATSCDPSGLVLWSNGDFEQAQAWAAQHGRKTLTQAMGPLMDKSHPSCRGNFKDVDQWCRYVHAASILFTLYISIGTKVVVLTPHPPQRLNPYGDSYYQNIEEPWLTSCCDARHFKIMFVHPTMEDAQNDEYQYWPVDQVKDWVSRYPRTSPKEQWRRHVWDPVKLSEYHPIDLKRERDNIMTKLYIYRTGVAIYWGATSRANNIQEENHRLQQDQIRTESKANPKGKAKDSKENQSAVIDGKITKTKKKRAAKKARTKEAKAEEVKARKARKAKAMKAKAKAKKVNANAGTGGRCKVEDNKVKSGKAREKSQTETRKG